MRCRSRFWKISLEGKNEALCLQFENFVNNADAWTPFPRDTKWTGLGRGQDSVLLFSILAGPMQAVLEQHWDTAPNLQSLVDSAYCSRLALPRITAHGKLIPKGTMSPLGNNFYSFQSKTVEKEKSSSRCGLHGILEVVVRHVKMKPAWWDQLSSRHADATLISLWVV